MEAWFLLQGLKCTAQRYIRHKIESMKGNLLDHGATQDIPSEPLPAERQSARTHSWLSHML